jgi:hypothetical protein
MSVKYYNYLKNNLNQTTMNKTILTYLFIISFSLLGLTQNPSDKMFTKTPNYMINTDLYGNPTSETKSNKTKFEIYYNSDSQRGYLIATKNGERILKLGLSTMYSNYANNLKVYYFQSDDGKYKISATYEENGIAIYEYSNKSLQVYYTK